MITCACGQMNQQCNFTFVTVDALIWPVCRTWGPLHRSISGPHLHKM